MATIIRGTLLNLPGTTRSHKVSLIESHIQTTPVDLSEEVIDDGATTDANGAWEIIGQHVLTSSNYRVLVDDIWISTECFYVAKDLVNTGKDVNLATPPSILSSSPYPVGSTNLVIAGWVSNPTGDDHLVALFPSTATDPTGTPLKSGRTNNLNYYRIQTVTYNTTYKVAIDQQWCSPSTLTVGTTYDVERHDIHL